MSDHRRLQRGLFRMQMDPGFATRVFAHDPAAIETLELAPGDLDLLLAADPVAVAADAGDQRKRQLLGNLALEYGFAVGIGPDDLLERFLSAPEFHTAIRTDGRLMTAFGEYAARRASEAGDEALASMVEFERAMVAIRRLGEPRASAPRPGELRLAPHAHVVRLRAGTYELTVALRQHAFGLIPNPTARVRAEDEHVLILADDPNPHDVTELRRTELLTAPVAALLVAAGDGLDAAGRAAVAEGLGATLDELDEFADTLVGEGVLVRG